MKKVFGLLITFAMLASCVVVPTTASAVAAWDGTVAAGFAGGTGTSGDPFEIATAEQLAYLASTTFNAISTTTDAPVSATQAGDVEGMYNAYTGVYFKLTKDIDLNNVEWLPIGRFNMRFNGVFDGNGHVVKNLKMEKNYFAMGLFGATGVNAQIKNLGIENATFSYFTNRGEVTVTHDYNAGLGRTEETDISWKHPVIYKSTNTLAGGTYATGALVGVSGAISVSTLTYMIENCFARNVSITNKKTDATQPTAGGLIGGTFYQVTKHAFPDVYMCINNSYVNGVTISGPFTRYGAFGGSPRMNNTNHDNSTRVLLTYCYAANYTNGTTGTSFNMMEAVAAGDNNRSNTCYDATSSKETIVSAFTPYSTWSADNASAPINGGYPVLKWENTWTWDGTSIDVDWEGEGTSASPYLISTAAELAGLASTTFNAISTSTEAPLSVSAAGNVENMYNAYTGVYFKLTDDIDLGNNEWLPIGRFNMRFNGVFDGNGHVVKNLKMEKNYFAMGLFGATGVNAKIKNLGIDTAVFDYCSAVGGGVAVTYDYDAGLNRTEATDASWSKPVIYQSRGTQFNRTFAVGTLVGVSGAKSASLSDYMIEGCFARNVTINQKRNDLSQDNGGGLIGGTYCQVTYHGFPDAYICIKDCYVQNITFTGAISKSGSFAGSPRMGSTDFDNATALRLTNCYAANSTGHRYDLFDESSASNTKSGYALASDTKETVISTFAGVATFTSDNVGSPKNAGYPILKWEKDWVKAYEANGVTVAGGNVTAVSIAQNEAVEGTVIVAVYDGSRFVDIAVATAADGTVALSSPLAVASGNTVNVFVWDSLTGVRPLSDIYSVAVD